MYLVIKFNGKELPDCEIVEEPIGIKIDSHIGHNLYNFFMERHFDLDERIRLQTHVMDFVSKHFGERIKNGNNP